MPGPEEAFVLVGAQEMVGAGSLENRLVNGAIPSQAAGQQEAQPSFVPADVRCGGFVYDQIRFH